MLKIGICFYGVCDAKDAIYHLRLLKQARHELFLITSADEEKYAMETKFLVASTCKGLFDHELYVKKSAYKPFICMKFGLDIMVETNLKITKVISPTLTICFKERWFSFRWNYDDSTFAVTSWKEINEIIFKAIPLDLKPDDDIIITNLVYDI
jgi:hypothetical protein